MHSSVDSLQGCLSVMETYDKVRLQHALLMQETQDFQAAVYATVSASFTIEQHGLPLLKDGMWNGDRPQMRLGLIKIQQ